MHSEDDDVVRVREALLLDSAAIARVHVDSWRTAYKDIVFEKFLADLSYSERENKWSTRIGKQGNFVFVAEDIQNRVPEKSIVGFASGGANRSKEDEYTGELYSIYILDEYRGKGIGKNLLRSLVPKLLDHELNSMLVWVLAKNPYLRFYVKLGGQYVRSREIDIGGTNYEVAAYGWKDVSSLLSKIDLM